MTQLLKSRLRGLKPGFSMIEMLVVVLIITILLALTVGAIGAYQRFQADRQTRAELATLDTVVDEYYTVKGKYPNIYGTVQTLSTTGATSGISPTGLGCLASGVGTQYTSVSYTSSGTVATVTTTQFDEPYSMGQFLAQVEGVGNIGNSGMLDSSGNPSTTSAVPTSGLLSQLSNFTTVNILTTGSLNMTYKNLAYVMSFGDPAKGNPMALYRDGWDRYIWYAPSTATSSGSVTPTAKRPRFGSVGADQYYSTTISTTGSFNSLTVVPGRDDILSNGGSGQ